MEISTHWQTYPLRSPADRRSDELQGIDPLYAQLLTNRGVQTREKMQQFIDAHYEDSLNPLDVVDMESAVKRIQHALEQKEHITIYGDYDADGVTSSALLYRALRLLKHDEMPLDFYIPHRLNEGCGLNLDALDTLIQRGTQLIITTDCASSDVEQVHYAREHGIDVIITDHHNLPMELPPAYAIVNPWRTDISDDAEKNIPFRPLCGVGVAFKLVQALYRHYNRSIEDEIALLDLVAIGTIADIVPLIGENHLLARLGLSQLNSTRKPGLRALIRNANLQNVLIRERDIAYALAPRLNAAGRMKDASIAFNLLITESPEEASSCVAQLEALNVERQKQTETLMRNVREEALLHPDESIVLISGNDWHEGILGLVAGKLVEEINKPVFVLSNDVARQLSRGSARSQKGFNIIEALRSFPGNFERYGGHAQAAGFTIATADIADLQNHLLRWNSNETRTAQRAETPATIEILSALSENETASMENSDEHIEHIEHIEHTERAMLAQQVDLVLHRTELLNYAGYKKLRVLGPFGASNPEPVFKIERVKLLGCWTSGVNKQNLRLKFVMTDAKTKNTLLITGTLARKAELVESFQRNVSTLFDVIFRIESSEDDMRQDIWLKFLDVQRSIAES